MWYDFHAGISTALAATAIQVASFKSHTALSINMYVEMDSKSEHATSSYVYKPQLFQIGDLVIVRYFAEVAALGNSSLVI